jgi:hypothetical protein
VLAHGKEKDDGSAVILLFCGFFCVPAVSDIRDVFLPKAKKKIFSNP